MAGFDAATRANAEPVIRTPQAMAGLQRGRMQMAAIRGEVTAGPCGRTATAGGSANASRRHTEFLEIVFAIGAGLLTLGILLMAAVMLVRNTFSLAAAEKARANEAAILQATLETVRDGIAYFTSEGLFCAFNAAILPAAGSARRTGLAQDDAVARVPENRSGTVRFDRASSSLPARRCRRHYHISPGPTANWTSTRRRSPPAASSSAWWTRPSACGPKPSCARPRRWKRSAT